MVALLAVGCSAIFTSVALLTKHEHWHLEQQESQHLAAALNDAIATLPVKYYARITEIIEKWIPWINLAFVLSALILPRLDASTKRNEASHYRTREDSDRGAGGTETYTYNGYSPAGGLG